MLFEDLTSWAADLDGVTEPAEADWGSFDTHYTSEPFLTSEPPSKVHVADDVLDALALGPLETDQPDQTHLAQQHPPPPTSFQHSPTQQEEQQLLLLLPVEPVVSLEQAPRVWPCETNLCAQAASRKRPHWHESDTKPPVRPKAAKTLRSIIQNKKLTAAEEARMEADGVLVSGPTERSRKRCKSSPAWSKEEDAILCEAVESLGAKSWKRIAERLPLRNHAQCLQRWTKVLQPGVVKGPWSEEEDNLLRSLVEVPNVCRWAQVARYIPGRSAKQCRERWTLSLDPSIARRPWTACEDARLLQLHDRFDGRWAELKVFFEGRTENTVKSRFKCLRRALERDREVQWTPYLESKLQVLAKRFDNDLAVIQRHLPRSLKGISSVAIKQRCPDVL